MPADEAFIRDTYARYLQRCNLRTVQDLTEFIDPDVNGPDRGWDTYAADLQEVIDALPDIHWALQQLIVDGDWLAARLKTTGTHRGVFRGLAPTGQQVSFQELVVYRWDAGRFVECWGDLAAVLRDALVPASPGIPGGSPRLAQRLADDRPPDVAAVERGACVALPPSTATPCWTPGDRARRRP